MADPKLQEAMAEIRAILKKHDIAGAVTLISETHSEYLYHIDPSWSVAYFPCPNQLRFKAKLKDFKTKEQQHKSVELTTHMICQIRDLNAQSFSNMEKVLDMLKKHFEIEHKSFADHEAHKEN